MYIVLYLCIMRENASSEPPRFPVITCTPPYVSPSLNIFVFSPDQGVSRPLAGLDIEKNSKIFDNQPQK